MSPEEPRGPCQIALAAVGIEGKCCWYCHHDVRPEGMFRYLFRGVEVPLCCIVSTALLRHGELIELAELEYGSGDGA